MKVDKILKMVSNFMLFFVMVAFLVSCCMILFITTMADSMDIVLTSENIQKAAKLTMLNVILLTLLFTIFDFFRRKMTTGRATNIIIDAGKKLTQGDFSVRIPQIRSFGTDERFNEIAK